MLKELPIGISDFKKLRVTNHLYVDKTERIAYFARKSIPLFLSRPRRFGKSLLVSTFRELFLSNRELFEGLWIDQEERWDWKEHAVLHFDFSAYGSGSATALKNGLNLALDFLAKSYDISLEHVASPDLKLQQIVRDLSQQGRPIVLLIDEYDYPLLFNIDKYQVLAEVHEVLKSFFAVIKGHDTFFRFLFITGVSKFANTSIFSGMNNLYDLSFAHEAANLVGYTREEIEANFSEYLPSLARAEELSHDALLEKIAAWYNGYRFSAKDCSVYNPFSLLYLFARKMFNNYWFSTGTPMFLLKLLRNEVDLVQRLAGPILMTEDELGVFDIARVPPVTLLYQAGYLTIKAYDRKTGQYELDMPNVEVKDSLYRNFLSELSYAELAQVRSLIPLFLDSLYQGDMEKFCKTLQSLLAHVPFHLHIAQEKYYHSLFQLLVTLLGLDAQSEIVTDKGRLDMVIEVPEFIHVFEIKFKKTAHEAMEQIKDRKYYEKFLLSGKQIILIGLNFGPDKKLLTIDYEIKRL